MNESKVELAPYDPNWPNIFQAEANVIKNILGDNCITIHHVGSTSIVGLSAKPIIDILPVVKNIKAVDVHNNQMQKQGYAVKGEFGLAFRRFFMKRDDSIGFNVHVYEEGNTEINRHLNFLNWLRTHENDKNRYQALKQSLAKQYPGDIFNYCMGKDAFVTAIDKQAGFNGYRMVIALMGKEWQFFEALHNKAGIATTINKQTYVGDNQKTHYPFVLYKGDTMIGAALVEFKTDNKAMLHSILLTTQEPPKQSDFYQLLTKWAEQFGRGWLG